MNNHGNMLMASPDLNDYHLCIARNIDLKNTISGTIRNSQRQLRLTDLITSGTTAVIKSALSGVM